MSKRSRFGCQTCKIRRVKCDETLPSCKNCTDTGRRCEGPARNKSIFVTSASSRKLSTVPPPSTTAISRYAIDPRSNQLNPFPDLRDPGRRTLTFFIECAGPALGGELDQAFWNVSVLQLCHQNPTVRTAVLAVSALYEKPLTNALSWPTNVGTNFSHAQHQQAFRWYSQSLNAMSAMLQLPQNQTQLQVALTSCILFASIEIQQLNVVNSMALMKCGYNLLCSDIAKVSIARDVLTRDVILPIFIRQTIMLMLQGYSLPQGWLPIDHNLFDAGPLKISTLQDARTQLFLLMVNAFSLAAEPDAAWTQEILLNLQQKQSVVGERFKLWGQSFGVYISSQDKSQLQPAESRTISSLWMYFLTATVWWSTCLSPTEMIYDEYTSQFTRILDHCEAITSSVDLNKVSYTFEMGVIPPLYFVGWRCRIPHLRRRALRLLEQAPRQESLFHRDVAIWAVRRIIETEEGLDHGVQAEDAPGRVPREEFRLRHIVVRWDQPSAGTPSANGPGEPHLVHSKWALKEDEDGRLIELRNNAMHA